MEPLKTRQDVTAETLTHYGSSLNPRNSNRANAYDTGDAGYARVVRGGMWFSIPDYGCTYVRDMMGQAASYNFTGFRMALPLK